MLDWLNKLKYDPVTPLLSAEDEALAYFVRRDILLQNVDPPDVVWKLNEPGKIIREQNPGGYWEFSGKKESLRLIGTFQQLRFLVEKYQIDRACPSVEKACEYIFAHQSSEGDIRGIIANQLAAYYHGAFLAILIKAGYGNDARVDKGMIWLLDHRQSDGGWVEFPGMLGIPDITVKQRDVLTTDPDRPTARYFCPDNPFSILATGMAIRPFCLSAQYRNRPETMKAAILLKNSFFKKNNYNTYQHPDNWTNFQYPFWWNNLVAAMDSLSLTSLTDRDENIKTALNWMVENQRSTGLWDSSYSSIHKSSPNRKSITNRNWISLSICRILKRYSI